MYGSVQNLAPTVPVEKPEVGLVALDSALQEQERIITMSYTLASEASLKSKLVAGRSPCRSALLCKSRAKIQNPSAEERKKKTTQCVIAVTWASGLVGGGLIPLR